MKLKQVFFYLSLVALGVLIGEQAESVVNAQTKSTGITNQALPNTAVAAARPPLNVTGIVAIRPMTGEKTIGKVDINGVVKVQGESFTQHLEPGEVSTDLAGVKVLVVCAKADAILGSVNGQDFYIIWSNVPWQTGACSSVPPVRKLKADVAFDISYTY